MLHYTTPHHTTLHHTTPHHTTPHHTTLHHTTPTAHYTSLHYTTPHHTTPHPHHTTPHHTTPHHTTPHPQHTTPHHTTPHHTTPHHTTPHHTTPHHTTPTPHHTTPTPTPHHTTLHHTHMHCSRFSSLHCLWYSEGEMSWARASAELLRVGLSFVAPPPPLSTTELLGPMILPRLCRCCDLTYSVRDRVKELSASMKGWSGIRERKQTPRASPPKTRTWGGTIVTVLHTTAIPYRGH